MNLDNLSPQEKNDLEWIISHVENRSQKIAEIKKNWSTKSHITTFISVHDVSMLLCALFSAPSTLAEFRKKIEPLYPDDSDSEIWFKGMLTNHLKNK